MLHVFYTYEISTYENYCYDFLNEIIKFDHIIIITNADNDWVESTCKEYLPKIWPIISKIKIVSAYDKYIKVINCPFKWKEFTFKDEIDLYIKNNSDNIKNKKNIINIVSIGDAEYEREAVKSLSKYIEDLSYNCYTKSIKLSENPKLELLMQQMDIMTKNISKIVNENESLDLLLGTKRNEFNETNNKNMIYNPDKLIAPMEIIINT
jgi:uncharacterized protein (DUF1499 family)